MKKTLALTLALLLCVSILTGCQAYAEQLAHKLYDIPAPATTAPSEAPSIRSGTIDGNTFTSTWLGYTFTLNDGMDFVHLELKPQVGKDDIVNEGLSEKIYSVRDFFIFYDVCIRFSDEYGAASIVATFMNLTGGVLDPQMTRERFAENLKSSSSLSRSILETESEVTIADSSYTMLRYLINSENGSYKTYYATVKDNVCFTFIVSCNENQLATLDTFISTFKAV